MNLLITNAVLATLDEPQATNSDGSDYSLIYDGYLSVTDGIITGLGPMSVAPKANSASNVVNAEGKLLTPALIDCHTHIVHGGHRANEFELRLNGASYAEVAKAGGGIVSTVAATRNMSEKELVSAALPRVDALLSEGVSLIEIKSGYGLDVETELRMLRAGRAIADQRPVRVVTSFLGAHALPHEYKDDADKYIDDICIPAIQKGHAEGLIDAVDGFCETIAFNADQIERVFAAASALGLPVKLHAEQLSRYGGSLLAARFKALSVDHVEYANEEDARALSHSGTVAVLLPGAFYTLRETQQPPIDLFRQNGVPMALATDANPGSSPLTSLLLAMNMGCTLFRMTPAEALAGVTRNAAKALGLKDTGMLRPGMRADLALWNVTHPAELAYRVGFNPLSMRIFGGQII
ncbi:imidazolonepropionase [Candidatus Puniceispirillum marinum]|uniref:Imidazolonepropionase n=1 Tax=Puniceispirillum marinum (strain IMCC1322) TaxID=488538 RepID=D5BQ70_PUNMI|nr:imidazolonepropionase [Candidatus Puniceispirillum marinum]ADE38568.1 imidazolonepropionase [Candidatus Puniceispirillum marinum IMCC1322]